MYVCMCNTGACVYQPITVTGLPHAPALSMNGMNQDVVSFVNKQPVCTCNALPLLNLRICRENCQSMELSTIKCKFLYAECFHTFNCIYGLFFFLKCITTFLRVLRLLRIQDQCRCKCKLIVCLHAMSAGVPVLTTKK